MSWPPQLEFESMTEAERDAFTMGILSVMAPFLDEFGPPQSESRVKQLHEFLMRKHA